MCVQIIIWIIRAMSVGRSLQRGRWRMRMGRWRNIGGWLCELVGHLISRIINFQHHFLFNFYVVSDQTLLYL